MVRWWRAPSAPLRVVITGSSKGIGKALAREFLRCCELLEGVTCEQVEIARCDQSVMFSCSDVHFCEPNIGVDLFQGG